MLTIAIKGFFLFYLRYIYQNSENKEQNMKSSMDQPN